MRGRRTIDLAGAALSRRGFLRAGGAVGLGLGLSGLPLRVVQAGTRSHGLSIFGDLKYPADFPHFSYVNPDAPGGGRFNISVRGGV